MTNFFIYLLSIILLSVIIPSMVYLLEYRRPGLLILFLFFIAGVFIFWPLERVCPYKIPKKIFSSLAIAFVGGVIFSGTALVRMKAKKKKLIPFTEEEAHRWIMESLKKYYILTTSSGEVISCGKPVITSIEPFHGEALPFFLRRASFAAAPNDKQTLEELRKKLEGNVNLDGSIDLSNRHYHWIYRKFGEHDSRGYILFFTDLTEEQHLIDKIAETGRLLQLKNDRLRKQGRITISLKRSKLTEKLSREITGIIISYLEILKARLHSLTENNNYTRANINNALEKSRKVMMQIRNAVHSLPYVRKK